MNTLRAIFQRCSCFFSTILFLLIFTELIVLIVFANPHNNFFIQQIVIAMAILALSRIGVALVYDKTSISSTINDDPSTAYEPMITFVIPCKNEEKVIARTILKCFNADYPTNKLEVIVINDGSTDSTIHVLNALKQRFKNLITIHWEKNRGKRCAMVAGFQRASGVIVVQLDSDSFIVPETLRNLIKPFRDPKIGAVCAHTDPENADENLLTKIQAAYYFISFRVLKAAESVFFTAFLLQRLRICIQKKYHSPGFRKMAQ